MRIKLIELRRRVLGDAINTLLILNLLVLTALLIRDAARLKRVKELYAQNLLKTGGDYYHAAMILQHSDVANDYLLAHELCVAAISKGDARGKWLAAASEDRFLMNISRPQRFATQFRCDGPNCEFHLYKVDEGVTDELRRVLDVPSLAEAKARSQDAEKEVILGPDEFTEVFEIAEPGKDFEVYSEGRFKRKK
jgi:hypothetical protein